ncbi:MAG: hypothetical protein ABL949_04730 [Fimbriimonadaceae bacterium]
MHDRAFDPELCLFCGQVFRFRHVDSGFAGIDGPNVYRLNTSGELIEGDSTAFGSLVRAELDYDQLWGRLAELGPELVGMRRQGHRMLRPSDPVETFFCFLCSSNNNIKRITQMIDKLASFGEPMPDHTFQRFPTAQVIAEVGEARLRELGFGYRARGISRAAQKLANEPDWFNSLKKASYADAAGQLRELDGVGPKLADCIALFALDHGEAVPVDTHLWQAFCRTYRPDWRGVTLTEKRMRDVGEFMRDRFGDLAGFAHHVLFVDNLMRRPVNK